MKNINVLITDDEVEKISRSGLTTSEYVRRAIDNYNENIEFMVLCKVVRGCLGNSFVNENKDEIKKIFMKSQKYKDNLYEDKEYHDIHKDNLYLQNENKDNLYEDKEYLDGDKEYLDEDKEYLDDNKGITANGLYWRMEKEFPTIKNLLNNPSNLNSLPDYYIKKVRKEYNISKTAIERFIEQYKEEIKNMEFENQDKVIHHK